MTQPFAAEKPEFFSPKSIEEAAARIARAVDEECSVWIVGMKCPIRPSDSSAIVLSTLGLNRIIAHHPADLVVEVEAGVVVADLQKHLAAAGQRLALDPPLAARSTIGGLLATDARGPLRYSCGTARDHVLGMRMIFADGRIVRSGAGVTKNVAGLDLHRLMIGSEGTLGLIGSVILRVAPLPPCRRFVVLRAASVERADALAGAIIAGDTRPALLDLLNAAAAIGLGLDTPSGSALLVVGYEDDPVAVEWQCSRAVEEAGGTGRALGERDGEALYAALCAWPERPATVSLTAAVACARLSEIARVLTDAGLAFVARAGNGELTARTDVALSDDTLGAIIDRVIAAGGHLRFASLPVGSHLETLHGVHVSAPMLRRIKRAFDPHDMFPWASFYGCPDPQETAA